MSIVFIDLEVVSKSKVIDYVAYANDSIKYHGGKEGFKDFILKGASK